VASKKPWVMASAIGVVLMAALFIVTERLYASDLSAIQQRIDVSVLEKVAAYDTEDKAKLQEATALEAQLQELSQSSVPPDIFLDVLTVLSTNLPKDVYLTSLSFEWLEDNEVEQALAAPAAGGRRGGGGEMGGIPELDLAALMAGSSDEGMGTMRRRTGRGRAVESEPRKGMDSKLVLRFEGESQTVRGAREYIENGVFERMRQARLPKTGKLAFSKVSMTGDVYDVFRRTSDGAVVSDQRMVGQDVTKYVAFTGAAVVNTGGEEPGE